MWNNNNNDDDKNYNIVTFGDKLNGEIRYTDCCQVKKSPACFLPSQMSLIDMVKNSGGFEFALCKNKKGKNNYEQCDDTNKIDLLCSSTLSTQFSTFNICKDTTTNFYKGYYKEKTDCHDGNTMLR